MKRLVYTVYHYFGRKVEQWTFLGINDVNTKLTEILAKKHGDVVIQTQEL